jgi:4-methylaminobutanoate oxidase (formaldehyde-forming)
MLDAGGGFQSDLTALRLGEDEYLLYVGSAAVKRDLAWLRRSLNAGERVELVDVTERYAVLALTGPKAAGIVTALDAGDLTALPYFQHAEAEIAGVPVRAARLSYVGEAGWELSCAAGHGTRLYDALAGAGARPAGLFAQTAMRIEKRHLAMGHDLDSDVTPIEAGLDFAVSKRGGFVGDEALGKRRATGPARRMVSIVLEDSDAQPLGDEPVYVGNVLAGQVTSAAFGYRIGKPVALAYLASEHLGDAHETRVELDIAGERFAGLASTQAAFDPKGLRMRH